eukprot:350486-Chlamydomonas_euryale.AAC.8
MFVRARLGFRLLNCVLGLPARRETGSEGALPPTDHHAHVRVRARIQAARRRGGRGAAHSATRVEAAKYEASFRCIDQRLRLEEGGGGKGSALLRAD